MVAHSASWRPRLNAAWGAGLSLLGYVVAGLRGASGWRFLFGLASAVFLLILGWRALAPWRERLLWRLRNRLLAAYVFIGLIPIVLLLSIGLIAGWTLYGKMAVYVVTDNLAALEADLRDLTSDLATALEVAETVDGTLRPARLRQIATLHAANARQRLPGVEIHLVGGPLPARTPPPWLRGQTFSGILLDERAELVASRPARLAGDRVTVVLALPLEAEILPQLGRDVGRVSLRLLGGERSQLESRGQRLMLVGEKSYPLLRVIKDPRSLPPPFGWWDLSLGLVSSQPTHEKQSGKPGPPLVLEVGSRISAVHRQLSYRLGEFSGLPFALFAAFAILFLLLEGVALVVGIRLTRTMMATVNGLQVATEQVQAGNFSHRIRLRGRDQLSGLAQAFNSMASSIEHLIEQSKEKQRLENELEIAREVQEQLFPRETPRLATLELVGLCQPARVVSGDYYDYALLAPGQLVFAIGDISGKGISAALLMATIQAALRSQVTAARQDGAGADFSPAALVTRLNRQLYETTSNEKYASLFCGLYNDADRTLTYTNAGHIPPVVLRDVGIERLEAGGSVVGVFGDVRYDEGRVRLDPGSLLVAFTDGLTEAENAFGEEMTEDRLLRVVLAHAPGSPASLARKLLDEVRLWTAAQEQADDMTLLVARAR